MQFDMVFEGGGAKGTVFVGALQELEARGHSPARLIGTSAGSIMATFLAAGYDASEMMAALNEVEEGQPVFLGFLETPQDLSPEEIRKSAIRELLREVNLPIVPDLVEDKLDDSVARLLATSSVTKRIFSFVERGGFYAAEKFLTWLQGKLNAGTYPLARGEHGRGQPRRFGDMNLAAFHRATGIDLSLAASDTTDSRLLILNHRTAPELPVIYAVRMSMSVPLLWHEVVWQAEWGPYRGRDMTGHTIVDGGLLSNFPIELFLSDLPHVTELMGQRTAGPQDVVGFLIDESLEVPGAPPTQAQVAAQAEKPGIEFGQLRSVQRVLKLVNTVTQAHDKMIIEAAQDHVVRLPARGYGTIEFDMTEARREALIAAGRAATTAYFEQRGRPTRGPVSFGAPAEAAANNVDRIASSLLDL
jgi:predicted acylesterase/phospholipase RssA